MAKVTRHTKVVMRLENNWKSVSISQARKLKSQGWTAIAVSENLQKAEQLILGLRSNELVDRLLPHLAQNEKNLVKTEIAQMATEFYLNLTH
tara:strand:+ start:1385 stop:1660 length:276 start_codon:yes stop_codon:yes gene_type:complete